MANEKKLDCVILGLLSDGEMTGYEIKKKIDTVLKYFWSASYGSIYPTLGELVDLGFAEKRETAQGGRNKIYYSITELGRQHLRKWLQIPSRVDELRSETLLKLFFGREEGECQALEHVALFRHKTEAALEQLLVYERVLKDCLDQDSAHRYYLLTVEFGIKTYRAYLDWCDEAERLLGKDGIN